MTYTRTLFFVSILIICLCFNKEAYCQNKEVDFKNLIKTIKSGALLNPAYDKFSAGDSYHQFSNSYVADQIALEENRALIRQTFRIYNKNYAQLISIGFIQSNYHEPKIIPAGFWKAMWSTATSYLTSIWR